MKYHSDKCIPSSSMDETHQSQQYSNTNDTETNGFGSFLWNEEDDSDVGILFGFHKFSTLAKKIHQNIENVAKTINHSAREMMKEFADMEEHEYDDMDRIVGAEESSEDDVQLPFPWEFSSDNEKQEELQKRIFDLSANKALFDYNSAIQTQKEHTSIHSSFQLHSARIHLIQRIMKMDSNLSALYSFASGQADFNETTFWEIYFEECDKIRKEMEDDWKAVGSQRDCSVVCDDDVVDEDFVMVEEDDIHG